MQSQWFDDGLKYHHKNRIYNRDILPGINISIMIFIEEIYYTSGELRISSYRFHDVFISI